MDNWLFDLDLILLDKLFLEDNEVLVKQDLR